MSCDKLGNMLLVKFSCVGAKDACLFMPATIVFWLLDNMPVNQNPNLRAPEVQPKITQDDWDSSQTARMLSAQCMQFPDALRMTCELVQRPDLTLLLNTSCIELMRRYMQVYSTELINLEN
ncbi:hypothetical protein [Massilia glaciei]|uniref:Uncharacterized protein n=1 Tax=Massilia glaciei TaxID=1524097 RepID=A0A2U2HEY9_9BURK|nr:hypothetical protein [Massilia glaciei]PWF42473.1 hypothetical protein C7C56_022890 [Massilia glaciei]